MITIKQFASLCNCSTQTLRYYDKVALLKPVKVDPWSGYRYYEKFQAINFVKIKNLQSADFTIDEIKTLLTMPDWQVYEAFERKIAEQTQKLERIKEIQRSYLTEKNNMEKLVHNLSEYLLHALTDCEMLREFGLTAEEGIAAVAKLKTYIEAKALLHSAKEPEIHLSVDDRVFYGADHVADVIQSMMDNGSPDNSLATGKNNQEDEDFTAENSETLWEYHDWNFVYEFIDLIPQMENAHDYCFFFELAEEKYRSGFEFPIVMVSLMLQRLDANEITIGCSVKRSSDGRNHFFLKRRNLK